MQKRKQWKTSTLTKFYCTTGDHYLTHHVLSYTRQLSCWLKKMITADRFRERKRKRYWLGSNVRRIPLKDPLLPPRLPRTPPSHQNSSLPSKLFTQHRYRPPQQLWNKVLAPFLFMPGKNSQCQGHNIYSYSHPCLPFLYRYQNILSAHNFEWMRLTLATPAKGFFCFYILPIEGSEH